MYFLHGFYRVLTRSRNKRSLRARVPAPSKAAHLEAEASAVNKLPTPIECLLALFIVCSAVHSCGNSFCAGWGERGLRLRFVLDLVSLFSRTKIRLKSFSSKSPSKSQNSAPSVAEEALWLHFRSSFRLHFNPFFIAFFRCSPGIEKP